MCAFQREPRTLKPTPKIFQEKNSAPSQWGRRMARLVGAKFDVDMDKNHSKNEGSIDGKEIVIKCAKSPMPPVSVLMTMLDRLDYLWAVFVMYEGYAEIWQIPIKKLKKKGYFTSGKKVQKRVEINLKKSRKLGTKIGTLTEEEVESCRIP